MPEKEDAALSEIYSRLTQYIKDIKFGSVTIIIQDGKIVQIEKSEKLRLR